MIREIHGCARVRMAISYGKIWGLCVVRCRAIFVEKVHILYNNNIETYHRRRNIMVYRLVTVYKLYFREWTEPVKNSYRK